MNEKSLRFSIVMCCYNLGNLVNESINSILNQDYTNYELLVVNDGSSDNTVNKLKEYASKDGRVKYIENKHCGASEARNTGIDNSTGDYIMFCDSDDYYEKDACETMLRDMIKYNVDVVRGRHRFDNNAVDWQYNYYGLYDLYGIREKIVPGLLNGEILGFVWLLMIKKEALKTIYIY